jgi:uncharacterized protein (DUF2461 family)
MALVAARCWRWIALTAALVHQPATRLAQVSIRLRGDPRMSAERRNRAARFRDIDAHRDLR